MGSPITKVEFPSLINFEWLKSQSPQSTLYTNEVNQPHIFIKDYNNKLDLYNYIYTGLL